LQTYIHILEGKLQLHSDKDASSSEVVGDLKKEMAKLRESNLQFSNHTSELETRLANSEAHSTSLACEVKNHEKEAEQRESAYRDLESHVALLDTSKDSQSLLDELEHREKRITELERNQEDMRETLELGRARLAADAEGETTGLRVQLASLNVSTSTISAASTNGSAFENARAITGLGPSPSTRHKELTPPDSPQPQRENALLENNEVVQLRDALRLLTARCAISELQSNQAQVKVNELTSQLSEAKLIHAELDDALPTSPIRVSSILGDDASDDGSTVQTPRGSSSPSSSPTMQYGSRRSPLPVLNVATSGMATVVRGRDFRGGRGSGESKRARYAKNSMHDCD